MAIPPAVESVLSDPARVLPMQRAGSILTDISGRILIRVAVRLLLTPRPIHRAQKHPGASQSYGADLPPRSQSFFLKTVLCMDLNLTEKITAMEVRISVVEWSPFTSPEGLEILATRPRGLIHYEPRLFCFGMAIPSEPRPDCVARSLREISEWSQSRYLIMHPELVLNGLHGLH